MRAVIDCKDGDKAHRASLPIFVGRAKAECRNGASYCFRSRGERGESLLPGRMKPISFAPCSEVLFLMPAMQPRKVRI